MRQARLAELYHVSEASLRLRRQFMRLTQQDFQVLKDLAPWAEQVADAIAKEFYDHQFAFGPTRYFFEAYARERNVSLSQLREALERAQSGYFRDIFREAAAGGQFGGDYFERRLRVGKTHNVINLPLKWYVGSYATYVDLVRKYLTEHLSDRPLERNQAERAIFIVFLYDIQAVADAFFYDYLQAIGLDLSAIRVNSSEEDLSDYYADLKSTVLDTLLETARSTQLLNEISSQLTRAAEQAAQATQEVAQATSQVAQGTSQQAASVQEVNKAVEQLAQAIEQIVEGARTQTRSVEEAASLGDKVSVAAGQMSEAAMEALVGARDATEIAQNGAAMVQSTLDGITRIKSTVDVASTEITKLGERSAEIGKIVSVIDDIAAQTNLLALNAAIEAARAGEQGRGFAVVADEVRKLAERVATATKEIADLIGGVQQGVDRSVKAMQEGSSEMDAGSQLAARAGEALEKILAAVSGMNSQIEQIAANSQELKASGSEMVSVIGQARRVVEQNMAASEQMQATASQVGQAIAAIAAVAEENSAAMEQVSAAAEQMSAQVEEVTASTHQLGQIAEGLQGQIGKFSLSSTAVSDAPRDLARRAA